MERDIACSYLENMLDQLLVIVIRSLLHDSHATSQRQSLCLIYMSSLFFFCGVPWFQEVKHRLHVHIAITKHWHCLLKIDSNILAVLSLETVVECEKKIMPTFYAFYDALNRSKKRRVWEQWIVLAKGSFIQLIATMYFFI